MSEDTIGDLREKFFTSTMDKNSNTTNFLSENPNNNYEPSSEEKPELNKEISDMPDAKDFKFDELTKMNVFGYGVGHFINDLAAAGWFNYLTIYLKSINPIDPENAGFYAGFYYITSFMLIRI